MHKCRNCGQEFEGNFCPNCGTGIAQEETANRKLSARKIDVKKIFMIAVPILIVALIIIILASTGVFKSCTNKMRDNKMSSSVQKIELNSTASQVKKILGTPDDEDTYKLQYYGGEYKSLIKEEQQLENKLMSVSNESEMEKILNRLTEIEEKMLNLEYPYTEIWLDGDKKVIAVVYDAKKSTLSTAERYVEKSEIFPKLISPLSNLYSVNFTAKEKYTDGSYYYGSVSPDRADIDTFKSGEYSIKWGSYFGGSNDYYKYCGDKITVGNNVSAGTQLTGSLGKHTFKATVKNNCTLDKLNLDVTIEGDGQSLTFDEEFDTYWSKVRYYITNITIPDSVTNIGEGMFEKCSELTSIYYSGDIASWCGMSGLNNVNLSKVYIGNQKLCEMTNITIPDSVKSIGERAFSGCSGLTSITIPDSVTSIGDWAFSGCSGLTSITIPDSVTSISSGAFSGCHIETATIPAIACSFIKNSELKSVTITSGESIGSSAFSGCNGLTSITIPDSVTSIGDDAFNGCSGLTSITIPDSVTSIGYGAFFGCSGLTSITIPDSVTSISSSAFSGCRELTSITVGENNAKYKSVNNCLLSKDGKTLILGCKASIIPDSVTSIGGSAFRGCSGLTSITIPDSVTSIGNNAFEYCSGLTSITIPDSVTSISSSAFSGCRELTSITISDNVTNIGDFAFSGCSGLTSITFGGKMAQWYAISKGSNWNYFTGDYTVTCTNRKLDKYGNVIE